MFSTIANLGYTIYEGRDPSLANVGEGRMMVYSKYLHSAVLKNFIHCAVER